MFAIFLIYTLSSGLPLIKLVFVSIRKLVHFSSTLVHPALKCWGWSLLFSQKYATGKSICIWFEPKVKLWAYLFIVIVITMLLYFLVIVSETSKGIDLNFLAYSELLGVSDCANKTISQ